MDVLGKPSRDNTCGFVTTTAYEKLKDENAKLRDLIFDMLVDEERGNTEESTYYEHVRLAKDLGIGWSR